MPQITTIRVVRKRSVQPEQFGNTMAEVELVGNVLENEDHLEVARQMLVDSRSLVYENLGMKLPASIVEDAAEVDTPQEKATAETKTEEPAKEPEANPRKKRRSKAEMAAAKAAAAKAAVADIASAQERGFADEKAAGAVGMDDDDDIPGDDKPQISTNPEDRTNPDDDLPGEDEGEDELTAETLHNFVTSSIDAGKLTTMQAKQMQREMKVARMRDLDTPEKLAQAKTMIDSFIATNEASA